MKVVGVCFETLINAESIKTKKLHFLAFILFALFLRACKDIGYIIPIPVVKHFLEDVEKNKGACSGFCDIGIQIQLMESENIRQAMGMDPSQTGILVNRVSL